MDSSKDKMRNEAITRMRALGINEADVTGFANGEYTKVYVDHENDMVLKMVPTPEEVELIKNAEEESSIPFVAYYIINDEITFPDGTTISRYILPYVWEEKFDATSSDDFEEGEVWEEARKNMLESKIIQCYTINADIPEYSEFGELPYKMEDGVLVTVG